MVIEHRFHERFFGLETCGKGAQVTGHRSSDDFSLWGYMKARVHANKPLQHGSNQGSDHARTEASQIPQMIQQRSGALSDRAPAHGAAAQGCSSWAPPVRRADCVARRMWRVCFAMSLPFEWRINHVFPLSITEVIDHKLSPLFGTHGMRQLRPGLTCHLGKTQIILFSPKTKSNSCLLICQSQYE